ncbi:MAG: FAD-binding oxidoreductase [Pyrinomonadaceae bacterium]|nr:FAD-binding oxidoreductase [Pyrinomonadaceae bacterium]
MPRSSFARLIVDCFTEVGRNSAHPVLSFHFMTVSFWQRSSKNLPEVDCDLCIIRAGITGASAALWLRRVAPRMCVAVVEARTIAAGASGRNAGMVLAGLADHYDRMVEVFGRAVARGAWQATLDHQRHLAEIFPDEGQSVRLERCGRWRVGFGASERDASA